MSGTQFRPHGVYSVHAEGQILVVETSGPWNKELIEMFGLDTTAIINALTGKPWGVFATVANDGMHTPESYSAMVAGIRYQQSLGRRATAIMLRDIEGPALVQSILSRMYQEAGEPHAFFDDSASAIDWLTEQLTGN